jgi:hypothetical protein
MVTLYKPFCAAAVMVPEITPAELSDSPVGRAPDVSA